MIIKRTTKTCTNCGAAFLPFQTLQRVCGIACASEAGKQKTAHDAARIERKEIAERRLALKSRSEWLAEAQVPFNAFIRERDYHEPCISCGRFHRGSYDAGHYITVGSMPALRFDEDNCHKQCVPCNQHLSGNTVEYRKRLLLKIGQARLDRLEGPQQPAKYTIDDAKALKAQYKAKLKELQAAREMEAM